MPTQRPKATQLEINFESVPGIHSFKAMIAYIDQIPDPAPRGYSEDEHVRHLQSGIHASHIDGNRSRCPGRPRASSHMSRAR